MKKGKQSRAMSLARRLAGVWISACLAATPVLAQGLEQRDSAEAAARFSAEIEALISAMPVERESYEVRINRCTDKQGGMEDSVYAVWIGARLVTTDSHHADDVIAEQAGRWREAGWEITRDRQLENGGANLAAVDPESGVSYVLDSGFRPDPERYVVGFFTTACFEDPSGTAPFGAVDLD